LTNIAATTTDVFSEDIQQCLGMTTHTFFAAVRDGTDVWRNLHSGFDTTGQPVLSVDRYDNCNGSIIELLSPRSGSSPEQSQNKLVLA
jgi:hypothetical protein